MTETIYERDGKLPVVGRTYKITDEHIEYKSVNRSFNISYDDITVFDTNPLGDKYKVYIETIGLKQEAKLEREAHSKLLEQLRNSRPDLL